MNFKDKYGSYALITGASSGIGEAFADILAGKGLNLLLAARREDKLRALSKKLESNNEIKAVPIAIDLTEEKSYKTLYDAVKSYDIGLLVNNAGFGYYGQFFNQKEDRFSQMIMLNILTFTMLTRIFGEHFLKKQRGGIILVSSLAGFQPTAGMALYGATKGFELLLGEAIAEEIRGNNIDITVLCPGGTVTEFQDVAEGLPVKGMAAKDVAMSAINSLGRKTVVIPGLSNKIAGRLYRVFPRKFVASATARTLKDNFSIEPNKL